MNSITRPTGQLSSGRVTHSVEAAPSLTSAGRNLIQKALRILLSILKWAAISLLALLTALLLAVSVIWGPTHLLIALLLAVAWVGLLALLVAGPARIGRQRAQFGAVFGLILLGLLTVMISQLSAYTPPIVDAQGKAVPGSIASLERIRLGGSEEWISVRGKSTENPVLLFLAGGPGGSQLATARHTLGGLEDHFVVVDWEQPGSGKSFDAVQRSTLTPDRYISDARELVAYLQQRFDEEKVYVVGESWGSALGIMLVQRYPELFHAFVGTGQMVDFTECDLICYNFALNWAKERGDRGKVQQLEEQGPPPYYTGNVAWKQVSYLLDTLNYMNQNPAIYEGKSDTINDILSPEYGLYDKVSWIRGPMDTLNYVYPQLWGVNFRESATRLDVPVYFLIGRHDVNAPVSLTEDYYNMLQAPSKNLIWFEHSGHTPWTREPDKFVDVVVNKVLAETYNK